MPATPEAMFMYCGCACLLLSMSADAMQHFSIEKCIHDFECVCNHTSSAVLVPYSMTVLIPSASSAGHGISVYDRFFPPALTACPKLCHRASYAARLAPTLPCKGMCMSMQVPHVLDKKNASIECMHRVLYTVHTTSQGMRVAKCKKPLSHVSQVWAAA